MNQNNLIPTNIKFNTKSPNILWKILQTLSKDLSYLELGVANGNTFKQVPFIDKVGVDIKGTGATHIMKTEDFFRSNTRKFNITFIDANHQFSSVLSDFNNAIDITRDIILIHDLVPPTKRFTNRGLCGDGYKLLAYLKSQNIECVTLEGDYGLTAVKMPISKINPPENINNLSYEEFVDIMQQHKLIQYPEMLDMIQKWSKNTTIERNMTTKLPKLGIMIPLHIRGIRDENSIILNSEFIIKCQNELNAIVIVSNPNDHNLGFTPDHIVNVDVIDGIVQPTNKMLNVLSDKVNIILRVTQDTQVSFTDFFQIYQKILENDKFIYGHKISLNVTQKNRTENRLKKLNFSITPDDEYIQGNFMLAPTDIWLNHYTQIYPIVTHYGDDSIFSQIAKHTDNVELKSADKVYWKHKHIAKKNVNIKRALVVSFQRSGTHFLLNTLSDNFINIKSGWNDIVQSETNKFVSNISPDGSNLSNKIKEQLTTYSKSDDTTPFKTHYQSYMLERHIDIIKKYYDIFYIIRDPRDVMVACYNFYNKANFERFIKCDDFSKFIKLPVWDVPSETSPFSYSVIKPKNIVDKWKKHVLSWLPYKDNGVTFIRFEDLKNNLDDTLTYMESQSTQKRIEGSPTEVSINDSRYRPDYKEDGTPRGVIGSWREYFTSKDVKWMSDELNNPVLLDFYNKENTI